MKKQVAELVGNDMVPTEARTTSEQLSIEPTIIANLTTFLQLASQQLRISWDQISKFADCGIKTAAARAFGDTAGWDFHAVSHQTHRG